MSKTYESFVKEYAMGLQVPSMSYMKPTGSLNPLRKKENRVVKNNQVAEKIEYTLEVDYNLFYKTSECKIFNKTVISQFSITPKSAGYNFGSDRSFEKLYSSSVDQNISSFIDALQINKSCLE